MNRSRLLILTVIAVACLATWFSRGATLAQEKGVAGPVARWEYKIVGSDDVARLGAPDGFKQKSGYENEVEEKGLNKLGDENWLLVDAEAYGHGYRYFLKRPKAPK